ncbi:hypothetical protein SFUMM280S_01467 [Streptomyces fumanus]
MVSWPWSGASTISVSTEWYGMPSGEKSRFAGSVIFPYSSRNRSSYSLAAASWVTVTVALPCPGAVDSKTAEPVPEESAAMVTFCAVFQFDGVDRPAAADREARVRWPARW